MHDLGYHFGGLPVLPFSCNLLQSQGAGKEPGAQEQAGEGVFQEIFFQQDEQETDNREEAHQSVSEYQHEPAHRVYLQGSNRQ